MKKEHYIRFKKTRANPNGEIKFDADLLELYLAIDEEKNILSLFKESRLTQSVFKQGILKLLKLRLIEQVKEEAAVADSSFFNRLREVLIEISGPLGEVLIEDAAMEMNLDPTRIPIHKKADFIYRIAAAIPGHNPAGKFKAIMLREIAEPQSAKV